MPGRLLSENVLLATEIVHGYNWRNIEPRGMLKVELRKAFDSVRWDFISATLRAIDMPSGFVNWIEQCISTASFTVSVNGNSGGFFESSKGLRQGDPLSLYLFVLAMEVFSRLLQSRFGAGYIHYHPKTSELNISHLMFADDVMVFFDGGTSSLHGISEALDDFASWSGLQINKDKTQLFHAGVTHSESIAFTDFGFPVGSLPIRYLGLPLMHRKLRISEYEPLMDKLRKRFNSWAAKTLSFAGRTQLIASVISGTVNFWISTFILPKGCIKKIESMCARFLWTGAIESSRGAKVAWSTVCLPKEEGGLGLRRFTEWNKTLCLRFIWLLFSENDTLWSSWHKHHYIRGDSFWSLKENAGFSSSWNSILRLRPEAKKFIKAVVGNGLKISFWFDVWTPLGPLIDIIGDQGPRDLRVDINAKVQEVCSDGIWNLPQPRSNEVVNFHSFLTTIPVPSDSLQEDFYTWTVGSTTCNGFDAAQTWEALRPRAEPMQWTSSVWFKGAVPKHAFNMWITHLDRLPTRSQLAAWGITNSVDCCFCGREAETRDHLFFRCSFSSQIWSSSLLKIDPRQAIFRSWPEILSWTRNDTTRTPALVRKLVAQSIIYHIWR
ncbi:unnamed protein product [Microthlaspi erraticum]|uniref:Reverse transcriptase domain-containing protein n=1 Tax=Microthlaspi erraticum TaxID=1685480 RepID=A0A6D2L100_9BRAS|nr:unnamed protein product [Microthlaspi erraticum]